MVDGKAAKKRLWFAKIQWQVYAGCYASIPSQSETGSDQERVKIITNFSPLLHISPQQGSAGMPKTLAVTKTWNGMEQNGTKRFVVFWF